MTGAASGIGRATALALGREGVAVACFDRDEVAPVLAELEALGAAALGARGDVRDEAAVAALLDRAAAELGPLGTLAHCAGVVEFGDLEGAEVEQLRQVVDVNLLGPMVVLKQALPRLRAAGGGAAIVFGSLAGRNGGVRSGPAYGASKGGVHALVKWAARAYARYGVRVNAIAPGPVETPMTAGQGYTSEGIPLGRLGVPDDLAAAVLYLASDAGAWITGQTLDVNGGIFMS